MLTSPFAGDASRSSSLWTMRRTVRDPEDLGDLFVAEAVEPTQDRHRQLVGGDRAGQVGQLLPRVHHGLAAGR
jgi:hypothetical protein